MMSPLVLLVLGLTIAHFASTQMMPPPRGARYQECPNDVAEVEASKTGMPPSGNQKHRGCRDVLKGVSILLGYESDMGPPPPPPGMMNMMGPSSNFGTSGSSGTYGTFGTFPGYMNGNSGTGRRKRQFPSFGFGMQQMPDENAIRANHTLVCKSQMMQSILTQLPQDTCCNLFCYCGELTGSGRSCTKIASGSVTNPMPVSAFG